METSAVETLNDAKLQVFTALDSANTTLNQTPPVNLAFSPKLHP